jgi:hypothetical protein
VEEEVKSLREVMEARFEAIEARFESRFEEIDKRFTHMQWTIGLGFTLLAALMGVFNFL